MMEGPALEHVPTISTLPASGRGDIAALSLSSETKEDALQRCTICNSLFNHQRPDGSIEKASILPCSHVFGNICIQRWLDTESLHQDCPICRRPMLYRLCGHAIKACEVDKAPKGVREENMPERCAKCRGREVGGNGMLDEQLREGRERMLVQERALEGLRRHLPGVFGGLCRSTVESVDLRIEDLKREWGQKIDVVFGELEEKEGRLDW